MSPGLTQEGYVESRTLPPDEVEDFITRRMGVILRMKTSGQSDAAPLQITAQPQALPDLPAMLPTKNSGTEAEIGARADRSSHIHVASRDGCMPGWRWHRKAICLLCPTTSERSAPNASVIIAHSHA
ncbi:hypothetical protein Msi02_85420 [Microbispora siamensis]|uniref:Uncharacterized protein n=1 Tax=Microbispora siamensis TaxID=564413 RepID=A0ABQ4H228_9ACTN|nr:hypothetical protein Msi02_85420 [Microbispora siamensis]